MAHIYVREQGVHISKSGERLEVLPPEADAEPHKRPEPLLSVPLRDVDGVALFGHVQISTQAVTALLERGVAIALLTRQGRLRGRVTPALERGAMLRLEQARRCGEPKARLEVGRVLIRAKVLNSAAVLDDAASNHPSGDLAKTSESLRGIAGRIPGATALDELLGLEGAAAAAYFDCFPVLDRAGFGWHGRRRRPPPDPVNALLSLSYTLAGQELEGFVGARGLDPAFGFLHTVEDGRPSLALDLLEPFRPLAADRLVLTLLNRKVLQPEDFAKRMDERGGVILTPEALPRFLNAWEESLLEPRPWAPKGLRAAMEQQVAGMEAWLGGSQFHAFAKEEPACAG
jgi:CRISP-associated protein Cas1